MSLPIEFHPAVRGETEAAYRWYEEQRLGLGTDFLNAADRVFVEIGANPARFGYMEGDVRAAPLSRFPDVAYYRVLPDRVRVLALLRAARDPSRWTTRN